MNISFPSWVYHRSEAARIVEGPEQLAALGPGWTDTPAAFSAETEIPEAVAEPPAQPDLPKRGRGRPRKNPLGEDRGFQLEQEPEGAEDEPITE